MARVRVVIGDRLERVRLDCYRFGVLVEGENHTASTSACAYSALGRELADRLAAYVRDWHAYGRPANDGLKIRAAPRL